MLPLSLWWLTLLTGIASSQAWLWTGATQQGQQRKAGVELGGKMLPHPHHSQPHPQQAGYSSVASQPVGQYSYRPEYWAGQSQYLTGPGYYEPQHQMTVALPLAVPFGQQVAGSGAAVKQVAQPVQLVPCLCPISRDEAVQQQQQAAAAAQQQQTAYQQQQASYHQQQATYQQQQADYQQQQAAYTQQQQQAQQQQQQAQQQPSSAALPQQPVTA